VKEIMNRRFPKNAVNFLTSWGTISFSRRTLLHGVSLWYRLYSFHSCFKNISIDNEAAVKDEKVNHTVSVKRTTNGLEIKWNLTLVPLLQEDRVGYSKETSKAHYLGWEMPRKLWQGNREICLGPC
jgi:hypothetical protein